MANPWFRLYTDFANDPKVQMMPFGMQRHLVMLFCLKCSGELDQLTEQEIAFFLRVSEEEFEEIKRLFISKGFIDDSVCILNWEKRQYSSERKQQDRHREKRQLLGLSRRRWINPSIREQVLARDARACVYCSSEDNLTLDHIIPEIKGGDNSVENLVCACRACNAKKREFTIEQAGMRFREGYNPPNGSKKTDKNAQMLARVKQGQASTDTDTDTDTDINKNHLASTDEKRRSKPKNENAPHNRISFNFETFQWVGITDSDIRSWNEAYPACDIRSELVKAREWVKSNPSKRKKNWYKFLTGWISRTQEKGGSLNGRQDHPKTVEQELMERGYKNCNNRNIQ